MNKKILTAITLSALTSLPVSADPKSENCPDELVNFWNKFSQENDPKTMPSFLVVNNCVSKEKREKDAQFYLTTQKRLDAPNDKALVDRLYADLNWKQ